MDSRLNIVAIKSSGFAHGTLVGGHVGHAVSRELESEFRHSLASIGCLSHIGCDILAFALQANVDLVERRFGAVAVQSTRTTVGFSTIANASLPLFRAGGGILGLLGAPR